MKIKPTVTPKVTVQVETFNGKYTLVALDKEGNEKPGSEFSIGANGYEKHYRSLTEGDNPQFAIKKNPK